MKKQPKGVEVQFTKAKYK